MANYVRLERRHFVLLAEIIKNLPPQSPSSTLPVRAYIAREFARALQHTNHKFDADRFVTAATKGA